MSRRSYKTVNVPREVVEFIDDMLRPGQDVPAKRPLGITSRDEFVRVAVSILAAGIARANGSELDHIQDLIEVLRRQSDSQTP